jgi:hypothetical protein
MKKRSITLQEKIHLLISLKNMSKSMGNLVMMMDCDEDKEHSKRKMISIAREKKKTTSHITFPTDPSPHPANNLIFCIVFVNLYESKQPIKRKRFENLKFSKQ